MAKKPAAKQLLQKKYSFFKNNPFALVLVLVAVAALGYLGFRALAYNRDAATWNSFAPPLRQCESSGNYSTNTGNGHYGAYQFDLQTWQSVGGTGYPNQASPQTQDALAYKLFQQRGLEPWSCGAYAQQHACTANCGDSTGGTGGGAPAPVPKVTVRGRFWQPDGRPGGSGAIVNTCSYGNTQTNNDGFFQFDVPKEGSFCIRPVNYNAKTTQPQGSLGPGQKSYEWQIAGKNCYHICGGTGAYDYDMPYGGGDDNGYDFVLVYGGGSPAPSPAPAPQPGGGGGNQPGASLSAPTGLRVVSKTNTTVTLAWNAVAGAKGYKVIYGGNVIGTTGQTSMVINGLHAGNSYTFYVKSYNSSATSAKSGGVTVRL